LAEALSKAQGEMKAPPKDKTAKVRMKSGGEYSYAYSDLATVIDTAKTALSKNGLAIIQAMSRDDSGLCLVTTLAHSSGEWMKSWHPLPTGIAPQEFGSALTYARRYSLCGIIGIAADEDDDAGSSNGNKLPKVYPSQPGPGDGAKQEISKFKIAGGEHNARGVHELTEPELRKLIERLEIKTDASVEELRTLDRAREYLISLSQMGPTSGDAPPTCDKCARPMSESKYKDKNGVFNWYCVGCKAIKLRVA
jgi:hypothetical protein